MKLSQDDYFRLYDSVEKINNICYFGIENVDDHLSLKPQKTGWVEKIALLIQSLFDDTIREKNQAETNKKLLQITHVIQQLRSNIVVAQNGFANNMVSNYNLRAKTLIRNKNENGFFNTWNGKMKPHTLFQKINQKIAKQLGFDLSTYSEDLTTTPFIDPLNRLTALDQNYRLDNIFASTCYSQRKLSVKQLHHYLQIYRKPSTQNTLGTYVEALSRSATPIPGSSQLWRENRSGNSYTTQELFDPLFKAAVTNGESHQKNELKKEITHFLFNEKPDPYFKQSLDSL